MGCVDVVPFIPIRNTTVEEADALAKEVAKEASEKFGQPFFLYEKSATAPHRENLAKDVYKRQALYFFYEKNIQNFRQYHTKNVSIIQLTKKKDSIII